jgi:preprotein translocase subunit SecA
MMKGIAQDFVRYVMHVQVVQQPAVAPPVEPALVTEESGPAEPGTGDVERTASSSSSSTASAVAATAPAGGGVRNLRTSSSDDVSGSGFERAAAEAAPAEDAQVAQVLRSSTTTITQQAGAARGGQGVNRPAKQETVVKDAWSKTPRNAPCPCGSGKKFKMCHGAG